MLSWCAYDVTPSHRLSRTVRGTLAVTKNDVFFDDLLPFCTKDSPHPALLGVCSSDLGIPLHFEFVSIFATCKSIALHMCIVGTRSRWSGTTHRNNAPQQTQTGEIEHTSQTTFKGINIYVHAPFLHADAKRSTSIFQVAFHHVAGALGPTFPWFSFSTIVGGGFSRTGKTSAWPSDAWTNSRQ